MEPVNNAMAAPDTLVYLMDDTVAQLLTALRSRSLGRWLARTPPVVHEISPLCSCGLNPLLTYFVTGERALRLVGSLIEESLREYTPLEHVELGKLLLGTFHLMAQREMNIICEVCLHAANCRLGPARGAVMPPDEVWPDKPTATRLLPYGKRD
jgi:hypothetical protein